MLIFAKSYSNDDPFGRAVVIEECDKGWWGCLSQDNQTIIVAASILAVALMGSVLIYVRGRRKGERE